MIMSFVDRTEEFELITEELRRRTPARSRSGQPVPRKTEFHHRAAAITSNLRDTTAKLGKLATLAKNRSIFHDPTAEIEELTYIIKQDLSRLSSSLEELQLFVRSTNSGHNEQATLHSEHVVGMLKDGIMTATKSFRTVLQQRTDNMREQEERRMRYSGTKSRHAWRHPPSYGTSSSSHTDEQQEDSNEDVVLEIGGGGQMQELTSRDTYHEVRADAVRSIEKTIHELGKMFSQLASMVAEQGDDVQRIDSDVEDTMMNVEAGQSELMKYYNSISSNRWLIFKVFFVLIVFILLFSVFIL